MNRRTLVAFCLLFSRISITDPSYIALSRRMGPSEEETEEIFAFEEAVAFRDA